MVPGEGYFPYCSPQKESSRIEVGCRRKAEYPVYLDDGGVLQRGNQPSFPNELVDGFGKDVFCAFIQGNQAMRVGISGTKLLRIVFLEDDLFVQRLVMARYAMPFAP